MAAVISRSLDLISRQRLCRANRDLRPFGIHCGE
jgi:hypothetical protein